MSEAMIPPGGPGGSRSDHSGEDRSVLLTVALVDDHALFVKGLELLLGPVSDQRIKVVGTACSVAEGLALLSRRRPDLALIDLTLPDPGGVELIRQVHRRCPEIRLLALSGTEDPALAVAALAAGAVAFLPKASRPEEMLAPLMSVSQGWRVCSGPVLDYLVSGSYRPEYAALEGMDPDTLDLWRMVASGLEITEIASKLFVSERTAKRMVADLREHLGVANRIEMAVLAAKAGLLDDDGPAAPRRAPVAEAHG